ncbi:deoxyguanosinetriphosphate triphosphohydrolase [Geobacter sulfurreducens]|uniref:Deoxyguanosinetriphosphate triphosphohydrolase-like protein n=1 Tax=Geobacter sulfurreducens (strain ATCC 51573 / DSM 12127 / PCA) TaxID=243231 RepID=DGTL1_GEOSL|nr:deoxyguanosinetriphosphate triphosphohydrolase [Geobacter sulfurreducens]Q74DR9.2 RecName: Full=Deoxyguanosinetriphosphate triphosphohydrolase-like protein [Geobacter sulfurreducens PCA]AAR34622.2 deoxyguanosine triphosphate triphosphohydrolase, putative [Geobacter sulfurreducens PCA]ADI84081.1 deoxyguanosine triphosphate triphosphohydrolase, putative [Geobacter sulfurreducens KN400]AJY70956.1 deoxyguanosinetriphosphate triphosphohydrolase [Geobacter sulfurreducens]QVW36461.1 deoxyguanosine
MVEEEGMRSLERADLAGYAARSCRSRGRMHPEEFRDDRPAFERDRDRIIHCAAFRRLEYKTQVFVNHEGDYYRTRLTHSLEVAQIGKAIARRLALNEELTEALALAHDLGHTPFGHTGEEVLNRLMEGFGGFEHNLQSFRVVDQLEERYPGFNGLNLSWEVLEGIIKHSSPYDRPTGLIEGFLPGVVPTIEAQIINFADEIAYNNHDIDDGLKSGYITIEQLNGVDLWREVWERIDTAHPGLDRERKKFQTISALIGLLIRDLITATEANLRAYGVSTLDDVRRVNRPLVTFSSAMEERNRSLKRFLFTNLYRHHKVERMRVKAERYLTQLFESYVKHPTLLPRKYQQKMDTLGRERVVCDYIAGMTDRFALDEFKRLFEPYERV